MTTLLKTISVAAAVCMSALGAAGAVSSAQAETVRIPVSDLNLNTAEGRAVFEARVHSAGWRMCSDAGELSSIMSCERAVREEATDNLNQQQQDLALRQGENPDGKAASTRR